MTDSDVKAKSEELAKRAFALVVGVPADEVETSKGFFGDTVCSFCKTSPTYQGNVWYLEATDRCYVYVHMSVIDAILTWPNLWKVVTGISSETPIVEDGRREP